MCGQIHDYIRVFSCGFVARRNLLFSQVPKIDKSGKIYKSGKKKKNNRVSSNNDTLTVTQTII